MQELYELPDGDRVCRAFAFAALQTWGELRDFSDLGEESITDYRILQLKRMCSEEVKVIKFNKQREEPRTGADWEWWFGSNNEWFSMRVQAKRLNIDKLEYEYLDHTVGKSGELQVDRLISDAKTRNLYPMYCFYNYWSSKGYTSRWPCGTFAQKTELWGTSICDAVKVQNKVKLKAKRLSDIEPISFPLMCLACCRGHAHTARPTLPYRSRGVAVALSGNSNLVPPLKPNLPSYVLQGINGQVLDAPAAVLDLDGILIVEENPNIYGEGVTNLIP